MRNYTKLLTPLFVIFFMSCKDETIKLLEDMFGSWNVDEIVYSKTGLKVDHFLFSHNVTALSHNNFL